jgi:hypothetical protein
VPREGARRPARLAKTVLAVLLLAGGGLAVTAGVAAQSSAPPAPSSAGASADPAAAAAPPTAVPGAGDGPGSATADPGYSPPVSLTIPSVGVRSALVRMGLDRRGVMETPVPVDRAGWFTPSASPGVPGATVIVGHVTWDRRPSVFFELGRLSPGDRIRVRRADGMVVVFSVSRVASFPKRAFPTAAVYDRPEGPELRLITCGGEYDEDANRYRDNTIVWASATAMRSTPEARP